MLNVRLRTCTLICAPRTMNGLDNFRPDNETEAEEPASESVTYVEISSVEHPDAYGALSQGGVIRRNTSVNDLYAALTVNLAEFFRSGDKSAMLEWLLVNNEGELDEDTLEAFLDEHRDD